MDILNVNIVGWLDSKDCIYVGRKSNTPYHLGNPYSHKSQTGQWLVKTKEEELIRYRFWIERLIEVYKNHAHIALESFERWYIIEFLKLAVQVETKEIAKLLCTDFHAVNYKPVDDWKEVSHAEIIYKLCIREKDLVKTISSKKESKVQLSINDSTIDF